MYFKSNKQRYNVHAILFSVTSGYVYSLARVSTLVLLYLMDKTSVRMSRLCVCKLVFCTEGMRIFFDEPAMVIDVLEFGFLYLMGTCIYKTRQL